MTQLIGVICEDRKKVILISDRMVTTSNGSIAFEHEKKCSIITPQAMVLTAGTVHEPELIEDTIKEIKGETPIRIIAENLAKNYRDIRKKRIENEILEEVGISSFKEFYEKHKIIHPGMIQDLSEKITKYDLGVAFILGGIDKNAHLYRIVGGSYASFDEIGFCCIGSGDRHASPVFAFYGFSPAISDTNALSIAFEAKKRAEMAGGVGKETDVWIIEKDGIYEVANKTIKELEDLHAKEEDYTKLIKSVEIEKEKI